jgi:hypothetical protein
MRCRGMFPLSLVFMALANAAMAQAPDAIDLTDYSDQQRWERAAVHVTLFGTILLQQGMEAGKTAEELGHDLAAIVGPGWSGVRTPEQMARAIHRNWQIWPGVAVTAERAPDGAVTVRSNRPYAGTFGEGGELYGVTVDQFETLFRVFHEDVAERLGMVYTQTADADGVIATIRER